MVQTAQVGKTPDKPVNETTLLGCIAILDVKIAATEKVLRDAKDTLAKQRAARRELQAKLAGVVIGELVRWTKGNKTFRGRVERFTAPRFWDAQNGPPPLALDVRVIRRSDGMETSCEVVEKWTVEP